MNKTKRYKRTCAISLVALDPGSGVSSGFSSSAGSGGKNESSGCMLFNLSLTCSASVKTRTKFLPANFSKFSIVQISGFFSFRRSNKSGNFDTSSRPIGTLKKLNTL